MGKIYEALEYTRKKQPEPAKKTYLPEVKKVIAPSGPEPDLEEEMVRLFQVLHPCVSDPKKRILQFIGSKEGEGASITARQFASVASRRFGKKVLLLDADPVNCTQCHFYHIKMTKCCSDALIEGEPIETMIHQIGETILFVGGIFRNSNSISEILSSPVIDSCFEMLKKKFEIIVIDSPPATVSPEGLAICSKVDGVILVVEAERVRWPVAQNTKENILRNGGKIIGIVFNKHRHYIPEFVYQRL